MRLLLINPWIYDVSAYDFWLKPVGLLILAKLLKRNGHKVSLIDCLNRKDKSLSNIEGCKDIRYGTGKFLHKEVEKPLIIKDISRSLKRYGLPLDIFIQKVRDYKKINGEPDFVFVSSIMTYWYPGPWEAIKIVKEEFPFSKVVLGGIYASLAAKHAERSGADLICPYTSIEKVIGYLQEIGIGITEKQISLEPDYSLYENLNHLVFLTSTGCKNNCTYCATPMLQPFYQENPAFILDWIKKYSELFRVSNVAFFDDAILINHKDHFDIILDRIISEKLPEYGKIFHIPNGLHAAYLTAQTATLMKKANVKTIKLGLETLNPELQKKTGGKVNTEIFLNAVKILQEAGFTEKEISAYVLINLPGQKTDEIKETILFCKNIGIGVNLNEYTPIPGTKEFLKLTEDGKISEDTDLILLNNSLLPHWWKNGIDLKDIEEIKAFRKKVFL